MFPKSGPEGVAANSAARPASGGKPTNKRMRRNGAWREVGKTESSAAPPRSNRLTIVVIFMIFETLSRQGLAVDSGDLYRDRGVMLTCCYNAFSVTRSKGQASPAVRKGIGLVLPPLLGPCCRNLFRPPAVTPDGFTGENLP